MVTWEGLLTVALVVVAMPYVLGPLAVKASMKFNPRPSVRVIDPMAEAIPEEARQYFAGVHDQFARLGFEPGPLLHIDEMVPNLHGYAAMYHRRNDGQQAMAAMNFATTGGKTKAKMGYVEFSTDFKGGVGVMTNDSKDVGFGPNTPEVVVIKAPWIPRIAKLLELHREACRRYGLGEARRDATEGWAQRAIVESLDKFVARGEKHGYLKAGSDGTYGLTWKGALIGAYTNLPPYIFVARHRASAAARELMRFVPNE